MSRQGAGLSKKKFYETHISVFVFTTGRLRGCRSGFFGTGGSCDACAVCG